MSAWFDVPPFRIGTSSYIIPDDILPNVRWLAGKVRDIELVLFDIDEYCNIPDAAQIAELNAIAAASDLTYTVHLPLNLSFSAAGKDISIAKALKVINATRGLNPQAFVCHLECRDIPSDPGEALRQWQTERAAAVKELLQEAEIPPRMLAVENLENYPGEWNDPVIRACGTSATLDIGHLFLQGLDPVPLIHERMSCTTVVHLHGVGSRDHQSLRHMPPDSVRAVIHALIQEDYRGVLTLEVFNETDFSESMEMIRECL